MDTPCVSSWLVNKKFLSLSKKNLYKYIMNTFSLSYITRFKEVVYRKLKKRKMQTYLFFC